MMTTASRRSGTPSTLPSWWWHTALLAVALPVALLCCGCSLLWVRGADDPDPSQPRLSRAEIESCRQNQATLLESQRTIEDRTARGRLSGPTLEFRHRSLRHLIALDYSGSMYGGYQNPKPSAPGDCGWGWGAGGNRVRYSPYYWEQPQFVELLESGPLSSLRQGDPVHVMLFNRDVVLVGDGGFSVFQDHGFADPIPSPISSRRAALMHLSATGMGVLPAEPSGKEFGRPGMAGQSRLNQLLDAGAAFFEATPERDGVLWVVTDNIIEVEPPGARGQLQRDIRYNRAFYQGLKTDPRWQVVYAWPIHRGSWLCGSTLIVYAMYYSSRERLSEQDNDMLAGTRFLQTSQIAAFERYASSQSPSQGRPFKLKPDDMDVIQIAFQGRIECPSAEPGVPRICSARLTITNLLNHRRIDSARIVLENGRVDPLGVEENESRVVRTAVPMQAGVIRKSIDLPQPLPPGQSSTLPVTFAVPPVETVHKSLGDLWESAKFERFLMVGSMNVGIHELRTSMVIPESDLADVYGVDALPEIFRNPSTDNLRTSICLVMSVENPSYLVSISLLLLAALVAALLGAGGWLLKPSFRIVEIDGTERGRIRLTRLFWSQVLVDGEQVARAKLALGGNPKAAGANNYSVRPSGGGWEYRAPGEFTASHRLVLSSSRRRQTGRKKDSEF